MEGQAVERLGGDLGAGLLGLLGGSVEDVQHFLLFSPASAMRAATSRLRGLVGLRCAEAGSVAMAAIARDPWGSSISSLKLTPIRSLRPLEASLSFWPSSSRKSLRAGSFQSWPYWLPRNASRNDLASLSLSRKTVESGRTRSGGAAA